ncbi:phosphatase PAP2 family protein [Streptomyces sp. NPDC001985]|uniref:phosphatase PAP2 family protein n=1 Tax=Streptomyces sp. NPDC001985 TaxID=3154406 RepID=UPI003329CBD0
MHSPRPAPAAPPVSRRTSAPARATAILAALSAALLALVAAGWSPLLSFDRSVAGALHRSAVTEPGFVQVNRVLTDWFWDPWTMRALMAAAVVWLWWRRDRVFAAWIAATAVLSALLQQVLKWAVGRERPQWTDPVDSAHFAAFPSGHAMTATVACGLLLWVLARRGVRSGPRWWWSVAAAAVSVLGVGLTRLYLGVHWPTDVLAGWLMGACCVTLAITLYGRTVLSRSR